MKEHGIGKRKSSYSLEQLEKVFGQGGWDSQSCAPVLINSSGLYQEMESDSSTMEDLSQEDWCTQVLSSAFQDGDMEAGEMWGWGLFIRIITRVYLTVLSGVVGKGGFEPATSRSVVR